MSGSATMLSIMSKLTDLFSDLFSSSGSVTVGENDLVRKVF